MKKNLSRTKQGNAEKTKKGADDFVSVARRLGVDESKERFEKKLWKIAKAKPSKPQSAK